MSGGKFDYIQYRFTQAADELESYIRKCESREPDDYGNVEEYTPETLERFRECEATIRRASAMLHRIDWLASGDDSEGSFHKRWDHEVPSP
jgi:hypothetical protein